MVATPLWFKENPERVKSITEDDLWIQPSEIAQIMFDVTTKSEYTGGSVIEASGKGRTRLVEVFNDAGP
jgi:hypothetical protein